MKAISLWQPWASLWLSPAKVHETRHWATPYRGPLLVHAAKKFIKDVDGRLEEILDGEFGNHWELDLPTGAIVGRVMLTAIVPTSQMAPGHTDSDDCVCGDFSAGRFAWKRGRYKRFASPVAFKGHQSLFQVPDTLVAEQLAATEWVES
jgi:hypothetical protein